MAPIMRVNGTGNESAFLDGRTGVGFSARIMGEREQTTAAEGEREPGSGTEESWVEIAKTVAYALAIAVVIRTFLFQPFNIPSASMEGTLLIGDYLFVSKYSYGYSAHSFPFSAFDAFSGRFFFASEPERGDVAVFKLPSDNSTDYIKRVIGLPGDRIQMIDGVLQINGEAIPKVRVEDYAETTIGGVQVRVPRYRETLPNGVSYDVLDRDPHARSDNTGVYIVPEGHFFMMGDNRDNSQDSRSIVGYVPFDNLVGRAEIIFFSTDGSARFWEFWKWLFAVRYGRLGVVVD